MILKDFRARIMIWNGLFVLLKCIIAGSVAEKTGMPICCATGDVLRIKNGGFINQMEKPSSTLAYAACPLHCGDALGSRHANATLSNSIAFGFVIGHWSTWPHWKNGGSKLSVRVYCPHRLKSAVSSKASAAKRLWSTRGWNFKASDN